MSHYAVGDIQGCLPELQALLELVQFDPRKDVLLPVGDLVARGPDSLGTLRLLYSMKDAVRPVLGNHDLHLLALAAGAGPKKKKDDDLRAIIEAEDGKELLRWLRQQPLLIELPEFNAVIAHAGIAPQWSLDQARRFAREVEHELQHGDGHSYFEHMYGNTPAGWSDSLAGYDRLRVITNYFTRMRFVNADAELELETKGEADAPPPGYFPWFDHATRKVTDVQILFGHWAALEGHAPVDRIEALDTGCVWGGRLTAFRLEDGTRFQVDSQH